MTPNLRLLALYAAMNVGGKGSDAYKFSMAEAGAPLRWEGFYYSHRKGGWAYNPFDLPTLIKSLLPTFVEEDYTNLAANNYHLGGAYRQAVTQHDEVEVRALPQGAWFYDHEPLFSVWGPSALASHLEPTALMINRAIQIATCAKLTPEKLRSKVEFATCEEEKQITLTVLELIKHPIDFEITVREQDYYDSVYNRAVSLVAAVGGNPDRLLEVGYRAVSCMGQHEIALKAVKAAGILRTSNAYLAAKLGMIPVGTMGHEHIMRMGSSHEAFLAMRDRFPGFIFYLPDTYNTISEGVPAALRVMAERPNRKSGIRFDSEHGIRGQYIYTVNLAREMGLQPYLCLESGWNLKLTIEFEALREVLGYPADLQSYGIGGFMIKPEWDSFSRDDVSAVYKLCQSAGEARMKFGDEPGGAKESIPGDPIVWRPMLDSAGYQGPAGYIAQRGENWVPPVQAILLTDAEPGTWGQVRYTTEDIIRFTKSKEKHGLVYSPATQALVAANYARRTANISAEMMVQLSTR